MTASPGRVRTSPVARGETLHRVVLWLTIVSATSLILFLAVNGAPYYSLSLEQRPLSPLHPLLRSSGTIGLKLGMLTVAMFGILFLYPLRKRVKWLSRIGVTRRWLRLHVLFGIATPMVATFHTAFRWHGLAGLAYWTMILVAVSGFVGRYVYAKIPRSLSSVKLTMGDLENQTAALASRLQEQDVFGPEDLAPLLNVPPAQQIRAMSLVRALWLMLRTDFARPFQVSRLRRRVLRGSQFITTLGGLLASHDRSVESIVSIIRRQARLRTAAAFLERMERIFHLWHVIHRPFSISFVILIVVHITVALSVGVR